jgi:hypothetical protein
LLNTLENALIHNGMKLGKQVAECNWHFKIISSIC